MLLDPIPGAPGRYIVAGDSKRMLDWIAPRIAAMGAGYQWQMAEAIGLAARGEIIAGMAIHDFLPHYKSCQLTFASTTPLWATRRSIAAMLRYPFVQLGIERITTIIAPSNVPAIRTNEKLGFKLEGRMRRGCGDEDALIFGLLKEELPAWIKMQESI